MKYRIRAYRTGGIFGAAEAWAKNIDGNVMEFETMAEAEAKAAAYNNDMVGYNVRYEAMEW